MNYVLQGIIKSNMQYIFIKSNLNSIYYFDLMMKKYIDISKVSDPDKYCKENRIKGKRRKYFLATIEKRKGYPKVLSENYDDAIELIGEWIDRRTEKRISHGMIMKKELTYDQRQHNYYQKIGNNKGGEVKTYRLEDLCI